MKPDGRDLKLEAVPAFSIKTCSPPCQTETKLMIKQKMFTWNVSEFSVKNSDGKDMFKVCGTWKSITDKIAIRDMDGKLLCLLYGIIASLRHEFIILTQEPYVDGQEPSDIKGPDGETLYDYMKFTAWAGRMTYTYSGYLATGKDKYQEKDADGNEISFIYADAPRVGSEHLLFKIANPAEGDKMNAQNNGKNVAHLDRAWFQWEGGTFCSLTCASGSDAVMLLSATIIHDKILEQKAAGGAA